MMLAEIKKHLIEEPRIIYSFCGDPIGPYLIFCAGIHGNEPAGVLALRNVFKELIDRNTKISGCILAFIGNRNALFSGQRFASVDLNRMWTDENIAYLDYGGFPEEKLNPEKIEMTEINRLLNDFTEGVRSKKHYFIDLHTTSAPSVPFAIVDKKREQIDAARHFPIPVVINFNDFISGTMLNYLEHQNFLGLVFEAGQHSDPASVARHEALIWLALYKTGAITKEEVPNYSSKFTLLSGLTDYPHKRFKIIYRYALHPGDRFEMMPNYVNFQRVKKGELVANHNHKPVFIQQDALIFMPLYQSKGNDGYFLVQRIGDDEYE